LRTFSKHIIFRFGAFASSAKRAQGTRKKRAFQDFM